jgi:hypothetical protein
MMENARYDLKIARDWEFSFRWSWKKSVQAFEMQTIIIIIAIGGETVYIDMFLALSFECVGAINFALSCFSIVSCNRQENQGRYLGVDNRQTSHQLFVRKSAKAIASVP